MTQPFDLKVYDADQVRIATFGRHVSRGPGASGYGEGEFCRIEPDGPSFLTRRGTDGTITRSKTYNRLVKVTITLMQSSQSNDMFSAMLALDEAQPNGAGVGTLFVQDMGGTSMLMCTSAWVAAPPTTVYQAEAEMRAWELHGLRDIYNVGSN